MEEVRSLKEELEALRSRLDKGGDIAGWRASAGSGDEARPCSSDLGRRFGHRATRHPQNDGLITELEFGEYKGRILKRLSDGKPRAHRGRRSGHTTDHLAARWRTSAMRARLPPTEPEALELLEAGSYLCVITRHHDAQDDRAGSHQEDKGQGLLLARHSDHGTPPWRWP